MDEEREMRSGQEENAATRSTEQDRPTAPVQEQQTVPEQTTEEPARATEGQAEPSRDGQEQSVEQNNGLYSDFTFLNRDPEDQERYEQPTENPADDFFADTNTADEQQHEANDRREQEAEAHRHEQEERDTQERADRERREAEARGPRSNSDRRGEQQKGLFARLRDFVSRIYHRAKSMVEHAIGRGRILAQPIVSRVNFQRSAMDQSEKNGPSVDRDKATQSKTNDKEQGRNWGDLLYHGFARRILGKDAYMYAVTQGDKQNVPGQDKTDPRGTQPQPEQPGNPDRGDNDAAQRPGEGSRPGNADNEKSQPTQEEMKGKFNSLHKIITNDLEDRYSNAKEAKEAYLAHYAQELQTKLTEINGGQPVQVSASRENGQLAIRINDQKDQFGNYPSFMHASMIKIDIDSHLNVVSAEGKVFTGRTSNGNFIGNKFDLTDTLGKYVVSDLARNFREDYNRGADSYNITSRNEFDKTIREAAARNAGSFTIDNVTYTISVKDNQIQVGQTIGDKTFNIALGGGPDATAQAKQDYEAKVNALREAQEKMGNADKELSSAVNALNQKQADYDKANSQAKEAVQAHRDIGDALKETRNQLAGPYEGPEKVAELKQREQELAKDNNKAYKQKTNALTNKNLAQADLDTAIKDVTKARDKFENLKSEVTKLQHACEEAKTQIDAVSQTRNGEIKELYETHVQSVTADRESITRAFEEVLPGYHNPIGGRLGLEDLDKTMEDTGRTYMEEALDGHTLDGRENEEPSIGQEPDRDDRQNDARDASEERE